jgi:hypothetical protein
MLQDLKLKICSAAIVASANLGQPGALGYSALVPIAFTVLRAFASATRRSLPGSRRETASSSAPRTHAFAKRGTVERTA